MSTTLDPQAYVSVWLLHGMLSAQGVEASQARARVSSAGISLRPAPWGKAVSTVRGRSCQQGPGGCRLRPAAVFQNTRSARSLSAVLGNVPFRSSCLVIFEHSRPPHHGAGSARKHEKHASPRPPLTVVPEPSGSYSCGDSLESPTSEVVSGLPEGHLRWHL